MTERFFIDGVTTREVDAWRHVKGYAREGSSVWTIITNYARAHGVAVAVRADDSVVVFAHIGGKDRKRRVPPGKAKIDWPGKAA